MSYSCSLYIFYIYSLRASIDSDKGLLCSIEWLQVIDLVVNDEESGMNVCVFHGGSCVRGVFGVQSNATANPRNKRICRSH